MSIKLKGSTDGSVTLQAPADTSPSGTDKTFTLPTQDGTAGQILKTDGSGALSFTDNLASGRNLMINGAMQVAQRGTSSTGNTTAFGYLAVDRFQTGIATAGTWTISQSTDAPAGFSNSIKYDCTTADTSLDPGSELWIAQKIEAQNLQHLNYGTADAQDCTFSFYFKTNKTGVYTVEIFQADATRTIGFEMNVTQTGWKRYEFIVPGDTAGTINNDNDIGLWCFIWMATGTNKTSGTFTNGSWAASVTTNRLSSNTVNFADSTSNELYVTGYQFELGRKATTFEHRTYGDELARCHRYFAKVGGSRVPGGGGSATQVTLSLSAPAEMRATPNVKDITVNSMVRYDGSGAGNMANANAAVGTSSGNMYSINVSNLTSVTDNRTYFSNCSFSLDAEL